MDSPPGHPGILRIVAPNPGPMTLGGTNTYIVGAAPCWVIDPGPADEGHVNAIRDAAESRGGIAGVLLTHSHSDHSAAVQMLGEPLAWGQVSAGDETTSLLQREPPAQPPAELDAGEVEVGPFRAIPTPGHAPDHTCFLWNDVCFCGDLILGEGSSVVLPAAWGGSLSSYLASLKLIRSLGPSLLASGHGPWITDPAAKIDEYLEHRRARERALLAAIDAGARDRKELLDAVWGDVPAALIPAAALTLQAHLEKLGEEGRLPEGLDP